MKKEKIDDNQLTFFDVIDGGKHEEDKKNIMKFKKKQLIDVQYAPYEEMFSGFNKIQAITFSYDLSFVIDRRTTEGWPRLLREAKFASQD